MALLIKKFGGTSVGSIEKIKNIAKHICDSKENGNDLVIVVSAMGHSTDELNALAESITKNPPRRGSKTRILAKKRANQNSGTTKEDK